MMFRKFKSTNVLSVFITLFDSNYGYWAYYWPYSRLKNMFTARRM